MGKGKIKSVMALFVATIFVALPLAAWAADMVTIEGEVYDNYQIVDGSGQVYEIADNTQGDELIDNYTGEKVKVTGTVEENDEGKFITVSSFLWQTDQIFAEDMSESSLEQKVISSEKITFSGVGTCVRLENTGGQTANVTCPQNLAPIMLNGGCRISSTTGGAPEYEDLIASYPSSLTTWSCASSYPGRNVTAYAVCCTGD